MTYEQAIKRSLKEAVGYSMDDFLEDHTEEGKLPPFYWFVESLVLTYLLAADYSATEAGLADKVSKIPAMVEIAEEYVEAPNDILKMQAKKLMDVHTASVAYLYENIGKLLKTELTDEEYNSGLWGVFPNVIAKLSGCGEFVTE